MGQTATNRTFRVIMSLNQNVKVFVSNKRLSTVLNMQMCNEFERMQLDRNANNELKLL